MKGLLIKDLRLIWHNKRMFVIMLVVMLLALQKYTNYSFIIAYNTMICNIMVLNTISLDEYYKSTAYLITLPVKRKTYVLEKYILIFAFGIVGTTLTTIVCILLHPEMLLDHITIALLIYAIMILFQLVLLPIQLKFGNEKGRIVLIGLVGCMTVVVTAIAQNFLRLPDMDDRFGALTESIVIHILSFERLTMVIIVCLVFVALTVLSYSISKGIMCKKEF